MSVTMAVHSGHRYHFYIRSRFNLDAWHEKQSFLVHACLAWGIGFLPRMVLKGCHDFLPSPCVVSGAVRTAALVQGPNSQSASFRHIKLQNASFRKMRFSLPGQTSTHLTEKRILRRHPHGKARSAPSPYPLCPVTLPTPDRRLTKRHALPVGMPRIRRRAIAPRFSAAVACHHSMACHA